MNKKKVVIISSCASVGVILGALGIFFAIYGNNQKNKKAEEIYQRANELLYQYQLEESEELFDTIRFYKDSKAKIGVIHGITTLNNTGDYNRAISDTTILGGIIQVTFYSEGTQVDPLTITSDTKIEAESYLEHYDFMGWKIESYYLIPDSHEFQLELYSAFTPHVYSIDYDAAPGYVIDPVRSYKYGTSVTATNAYLNGYSFTGYTVGDDPTLHNPFVVTETDGENFLLKAHYEPNTYHYVFDPVGGTCPIDQNDYVYDSEVLLPIAVKEGYSFKGWFTSRGKKLVSPINIYENTTLHAEYDVIEYEINYDLNGGEFLDTYPTGYNVESGGVAIPNAHKKGYLFTGWILDNQPYYESKVNYSIPANSMGDITLRACYRAYEAEYGNSQIKSLGDFDIPEQYPHALDKYIPGYVIPYNITSLGDDIFSDEIIDQFGVETRSSSFDVIGDKNQYLVDKTQTKLMKMAFRRTNGLFDLELPSSITSIEDYALSRTPLRGIVSESVTSVAKRAFIHSSVTSISFPNLNYIGDEAFNNCEDLASLNDSLLNVISIGEGAFSNTDVSQVVIGDDLEYIGDRAFGASLTNINLTSFSCTSKKFESLDGALAGQINVTYLSLSKITDSIFDIFKTISNLSLETLRLVGVTDIPDDFLCGIRSFSNLIVEDEYIRTIGDRAFKDTDACNIPTLTKVTSIGESAFEGCENLESVTLEETTYIGDYAFKNSGLQTITLPATITHLGDGIFEGCNNLERVIFTSPFQAYDLNRLFGDTTVAPNLVFEVRGEGTLKMNAFRDLHVGKSVTLGASVSLSAYAFKNASTIKTVTYNFEVNEIIPTGCFENAFSLESIDITGIVEFKDYAFNNCTSLLKFDNSRGINILGDNVLKIGDFAFGNLMKITALEIQNTSIICGSSVFMNDTCNLCLPSGLQLSEDTLIGFMGKIYN